MNGLSIELYKRRHLKLWLIPLLFCAVLSLWIGSSFRNPDPESLAQGYQFLLYQIPLLNCVIMPIMIAVIASRLCDMEIKGQTLKLLYTLQEKQNFFDCKYLHEVLYLFLFVAVECLLVVLAGNFLQFTEKLPWHLLLRHGLVTLLVGAVILIFQHYLSLTLENQIVPLLTGLVGSFLGLFSMFFPAPVSRFVIWGYFGAFEPFYMDWDSATRIITFTHAPFPLSTLILFSLFGILAYLVCRTIIVRKEV